MKKLLWPLRIIYTVYAFAIFLALMIPVVIFVLLVLPLGEPRSGNLIYRACHIWGRIWFFCLLIKHKNIYEAPHDKTKQFIFVSNHGSYMDIPCIVRALVQPIRVLGKHEMIKYPIFGIIYKAAVITVDRSDAAHRAQSIRQLKATIGKGISVFILPEGTFNESEQPLKSFFDGAFRIALETQTPIKPVLFVDAVDRLHWRSIFSLTPGRNRVVFLEEIQVDAFSEKEVGELKQKVYDLMDAGMRRYREYPS